MPIYEFECDACGDRFERLQKLSDPDPAACPKCGAAKVKRLINAPAFRLAGGGWYETDFKKDGDRKRNLAGGDEAPKPEASKESKTSAAPEKPAAASKPESSSAKSGTAAE